MKYLIFLFCLIAVPSWSQQVIVKGQITDTNGKALVGATVEINNKNGFVTDGLGQFQINVDAVSTTINLVVRYLGYETVDTSFVLKNREHFIRITMKDEVFNQPKIEVVASGFNAFDQHSWVILDFKLIEDKILILYVKKRKPIIGLFESNGFIISEQKLKKDYTSIHKSCGGNYHLIGEQDCVEISIDNGNAITKQATYSLKKYESLIKPCVYKQGKTAIFKTYAQHNKKASYHGFRPLIGKQHILDVVDQKGAAVAQSYYRDIIGTYFRTAENPDSAAINYGTIGENVIALQEWSGDVNDLIINNDMHELVGLYLSTELKEVKTVELPLEDNLLVLDLTQSKAHHLDVTRFYASDFPIDESILSFDFDYYYDPYTKKCVIINDKEIIAVLSLDQKGAMQTSVSIPLELNGKSVQGLQFRNNILYYFSRNSNSGFATRLHQFKLESLD